MKYFEPWNDRNFIFARRDVWPGAQFEEVNYEASKLRIYSFRVCVVIILILGALVWVD